MILGTKCECCGLWSRVVDLPNLFRTERLPDTPYYCDECDNNVTYNETKVTIKL